MRDRARTALAARLASSLTVEGGLDEQERAIVEACRPYTLVSTERLVATMDAVMHVVRSDVRGALVECGVWRGGNVMAMLLTLQHLGIQDRDVYLYDTFEGMTEPTGLDTSPYGHSAVQIWRQSRTPGGRTWERWHKPEIVGREAVEKLLNDTGYPVARLHLVAGPVEETLPSAAPAEIAVLRLDTDWYESTHHELEHLYPRIRPGGVLLVDDYGHWDGARRAVDEYFERHVPGPLLARTDYSGRLAIKPGLPYAGTP